MKVQVEKIIFDPVYSVEQQLQLEFYNVEQLLFKKVFVEDTLRLRARNVKEARFVKSNFAHIPAGGFQISNAKTLEIRDSIFWRVTDRSIQVCAGGGEGWGVCQKQFQSFFFFLLAILVNTVVDASPTRI